MDRPFCSAVARLAAVLTSSSALAAHGQTLPGAPASQVRAPPPAPAQKTSTAETPRLNKAAPVEVSGVTVTVRREPPRVVSTFPANGATVTPGVLVLRVTYDERMQDEGWSYVTSASGDYPDCSSTPRLLDDRKSFALICRTAPKKTYAVWFNRDPYANFSSISRKPAVPYELRFATSSDDPIWTLKEALALDPGLPADSNPAEPVGKARPGQERDPP